MIEYEISNVIQWMRKMILSMNDNCIDEYITKWQIHTLWRQWMWSWTKWLQWQQTCKEWIMYNIENKYADVTCRWILYIISKSKLNLKSNTWQSNKV